MLNTLQNPDNHGLSDALVIDIKEHMICFMLPAGASMKGTLELPGGAIISGNFEGSIVCSRGSIIFPKGSAFKGSATAENIFVEGAVENPGSNRISVLQASTMIAVSTLATGRADMIARAFNITSTTFDGRMHNVNGHPKNG
jgi:hypothetical protein